MDKRGPLGLTGYQWLVLFAAWLGWGFDVFDGLLFNYVSRLCIPDLLHLDAKDPQLKQITTYWTAALTSALLIGWAAGGILFGKLADRLGRTRTLLFTMLTYALATAACALSPNIWFLFFFRFVASLGIGGEWAAGASLVAETVPEAKRVTAGALLYTSAPAGLFLATFVNDLFTKQITSIASDPHRAWRAVFLTGLVPALVAIVIRLGVKEPESWKREGGVAPRIRELFTPDLRRRTLGGLAMAVTALITWWSCNAFIPLIAGFLAQKTGALPADYIYTATTWFNVGGLVGTLATIPIATFLGRRPMFAGYFALGAIAIWLTFGVPMEPHARLALFGFIGLTIFGIFGAFTFYLPELFPTRLRGTGAGFCYNTGRVVTAGFTFAIGAISLGGYDPLAIIKWVAFVPVVGLVLLALGFGVETRGQSLVETPTLSKATID